MLAVPDLEMLARLLLQPTYPVHLHRLLLQVIFGGQQDRYDYHKVSVLCCRGLDKLGRVYPALFCLAMATS